MRPVLSSCCFDVSKKNEKNIYGDGSISEISIKSMRFTLLVDLTCWILHVLKYDLLYEN